MPNRRLFASVATLGLLVSAGFGAASPARAATKEIRRGGLVFSIDEASGRYALDEGPLHFAGRLANRPVRVTKDAAGLRFALAPDIEARVAPAAGNSAALSLSWTVVGPQPATRPPVFPDFTQVPAGLHSLSHRQENFAPPVFDDPQNVSTPWLLFGGSGPALLISPVRDVFVASMLGDGKSRVAVGFNPEVRQLPAGYTGASLIAAGADVIAAYDAWGTALRASYGRAPAKADADPILRSIGVLTDNAGGHYYYNYEYAEGLSYEDSLVRFIARSRQAGLPFGYLQLDSWWYPKSSWNPHEPVSGIKNAALPAQPWNHYGGMLEWRADPGVFPKGIAAFHERVKLPFLAHNRFIDKDSPYHRRFAISGLAAVDRGYWNELASYAADSSIATYLQDWLDAIYKFSPELHSVPGKGLAFLDGMASAMAARGITMQYCMEYPLHLLQGAKYPNLTTIRAAGDGLTRSRWAQLAFNARLIREVGAWPATDVMPSADTAAMLFATLSGGPVGVGDSFEQLDRANIFKVARGDGEIVKPDEPLTPLARSYLSQARKSGEPIIAATFTRHQDHRTAYLLAFAETPRGTGAAFAVRPAELGLAGPVVVYDPASRSLAMLKAGEPILGKLAGPDDDAYRIVAPVTRSGIAVLGDLDQFVPMGRKRIAAYRDTAGGVRLDIAVAPREQELSVAGYAPFAVSAEAEGGAIRTIERDPASGMFRVRLRTSGKAASMIRLRVGRQGPAGPRRG